MTSVCFCVAKMVIAMLAHVDLCSGIGGFALGFQWAGLSRPVLFCDIEEWSRRVLAKHWPDVPISDDVKELASDPRRLVPDCDILTAGYPCQPFSLAGKRRGEGEGYAVQPFVVPACALDAPHRRDRVWIIAAHADCKSQSDVTGHGEEGQWLGYACNVGHAKDDGRDRWPAQVRRAGAQDFTKQPESGVRGKFGRSNKDVADARREGLYESRCLRNVEPKAEQQSRVRWDDASGGAKKEKQDVAHANGERLQGQRPKPSRISEEQRDLGDPCRRVVESSMGGVADGLSTWLDEPRDIPRVATGVKQRAARLKGLGNAIVPQIAMQIGLTIKAVENG